MYLDPAQCKYVYSPSTSHISRIFTPATLDLVSKLTFISMNEKRSHPSSVPGDDDSDSSTSYSPSVSDVKNNGGREYSFPLRSLRTSSHANLHVHRADLSQAPISDLDLL